MEVTRYYPGSIGEIIQGVAYGKELLLSCPVNLFTSVRVFESLAPVYKKNYPKCNKFMESILQSWGQEDVNNELDIEIRSEIPIGKGFASSTADITALYLSMIKLFNHEYNQQELVKQAVAIEPTDSIIFPQMTLFDYKTGKFQESLGNYIEFFVLVFEGQRTVNTIEFNFNVQANLADIEDLIPILAQSIREGNIKKLAYISSESIARNQGRMKYNILPMIQEICCKTAGLGIIGAHSGDFLGIIYNDEEVLNAALQYRNSVTGYKVYPLKAISYYSDNGKDI